MELGAHLNESLKFVTVFSFTFFGREIPVTETVVVTWAVMAVLIIAALLLTRNLKQIPRGVQCILEGAVEFLNGFSRRQFGARAGVYGPYVGTVFLFLLLANIIPVLSPIAAFGREPPFTIKPPARDINFTAALALISILLVLFGGIRARGLKGWGKHLLSPVPMMLPFNLLEFVIRPLSLCLRLFGNILGGFIIMLLIEFVAPIIAPPVLSLYFDFLDGLIQALVFTFLTILFIAEAVEGEKVKN
ncbi:MAG: F0F1 ATP synthase subunit A [Spirochaetaceae bacterium]|jgi:F-type H+-transporting ATPase subunit a|nr:F0F1 ATP synthase subunit A [Spirochaetaceae bacterium]